MHGDDRTSQVSELFKDQLHTITDDLLHFVDEEIDSVFVLLLMAGRREHRPQEQPGNRRGIGRLYCGSEPQVVLPKF